MEEHDEKADELEREADQLEEKSDEVGQEVEDAKSQWQAHQADENVPGAVNDETIDMATGADDREDEDEGG